MVSLRNFTFILLLVAPLNTPAPDTTEGEPKDTSESAPKNKGLESGDNKGKNVLVPPKIPEGLPVYTILPCQGRCENFERAHPIGPPPKAAFPKSIANIGGTPVEGMGLLNLTVTKEGVIKDALIVEAIGPIGFAEHAVANIKRWKFEPAKMDGKAVESNLAFPYAYLITSYGGGRKKIAHLHRDAVKLATENHLNEAITVLEAGLAQDDLNFYERTILSQTAAIYYGKKNDLFNAYRHARKATSFNTTLGRYTGSIVGQNLRLQLELAARLGEYGEALGLYEYLKFGNHLKDNDPIHKIVDELNNALARPVPVAVLGKIITENNDSKWTHNLYRRSFSFDGIKGRLDRFTLRCDQQSIESPISDKAEWTIPYTFSNCLLFVYGAPDTTFRVIENLGDDE